MKLFGFNITRQEPQNLTQKSNRSLRKQIAHETELMRIRQDIQRWRLALNRAESKSNPNRVELLRCIKDALLDAQIQACLLQRKNAILCRDFAVMQEDEENDEQTDLLKVDWFYKFINFALDVPAYGYTLVDFGPMIENTFPEMQVVPREYVCPEFMVVSQYQGGCDGVDILDPRYQAWNMFVGDRFDLGYLSKVCAHAIWKKSSIGNWSEYNSKFGIPMRIGKTATSDDVLLTNMEEALKNAGESFWAVIDKDDSIDFLDAEKSGAFDVFDKMIERMNSEISKLILGQTGTTDEKSFVGSAQIHYNVRQDIIESDARFIENVVNGSLIPWLNKHHGYSITGTFKFNFSQSMTMQEQADLVVKMMPYVKFDMEWLESNFNIEIDDTIEGDTGMEDSSGKKSKTSYENFTSSYQFTCKYCGGGKDFDIVNIAEDLEEIILQSVWLGSVTSEKLPNSLYDEISNALISSLNQGYGQPEGLSSSQLHDELKYSARHFAAAKVYQQVLLFEELKGKYDTYEDFKKAASDVYQKFNTDWMNTEANTARSSARSASLYKTAQVEKNILPLLEYQTIGDARVRPEHAALDGITRKVDDEFWGKFMPPNGWGCRCTVLRKSGDSETSLKGFTQPDDVPDLFLFNPALDETLFPLDHPYFNVKDKEFALKNFGLPI